MCAKSSPSWLECPDCGASCRDRLLKPGSELLCGRCGARVKKHASHHSLQIGWAFASAGLVFWVLANLYPVLTFEVAGKAQSNWIFTGVVGLFQAGYWPVGVLVFFSAMAAPLLHLLASWYALGACCLSRPWPGVAAAIEATEKLASWSLIPVFAVACVVSVVKLDLLGTVEWRLGAVWVIALSLCCLLTMQLFDRSLVESQFEGTPK